MAFQSMLIVLVGSTPAYRTERQDAGQQELLQRVIFTEDADSIVTEVRDPSPGPAVLRGSAGVKLEPLCLCSSVVPGQAAGL